MSSAGQIYLMIECFFQFGGKLITFGKTAEAPVSQVGKVN